MAAQRFVAVVGARVLPEAWAGSVAAVVRFFTAGGWGIGSGGARGADAFALQAVLATGGAGCARSVVFLPGSRRGARTRALCAFVALGGRVVPGAGVGRQALLARSARLARASSGVVAFLWGPSRGSVFTVREAVRSGKPAAVVLAGGGAVLPAFPGGTWAPCAIGGVAAFRWVPGREGEAPVRTTALGRIFKVPEGEPVEALLGHISRLTQGERLWFEQGVLAGDTVLVPHEALSDTPAWLAVPRLRRRFRCSVREAAGLAELFLALEAGPEVVGWCEREARRRSVAVVIEDLVHLVAQLALAEAVAESDALEEAERLGDGVEAVDSDGSVDPAPVRADADGAWLAWHSLGSVQPEVIECPVCGEVYEGDDEAASLPACPSCGVTDTWEARQGAGFRRLIAEIDECVSVAELAVVGKRLYALGLAPEQAGVAWSHYRLRKVGLEAAVALGAPARAMAARIERASERELPRLGAWLYRLQHRHGAAAVTPGEWRRLWQAYHARRGARVA